MCGNQSMSRESAYRNGRGFVEAGCALCHAGDQAGVQRREDRTKVEGTENREASSSKRRLSDLSRGGRLALIRLKLAVPWGARVVREVQRRGGGLRDVRSRAKARQKPR